MNLQAIVKAWSGNICDDNAPPHTTAVTIEMIQKLKFELLPNPAYSLDITQFDYHIFRLLKNILCGFQFANEEEVKDAVHS
jgi:hypothetical protein